MEGMVGRGPCTSTNNLSATTQGSAESCLRSALAGARDGTDDCITVHPTNSEAILEAGAVRGRRRIHLVLP
jgi:hypothetical protein